MSEKIKCEWCKKEESEDIHIFRSCPDCREDHDLEVIQKITQEIFKDIDKMIVDSSVAGHFRLSILDHLKKKYIVDQT